MLKNLHRAARPLKGRVRSARSKARMLIIIAILILGGSGLGFAMYFQSFETDTYDWVGAVRVPTGTDGVPSKVGAFHAEAPGGAYTFWGGESRTFPPGGYTTTIDIYLDTLPPYKNGTGYANDTRFDWDSAIGTPQCGHRRDFVFNAGFYTDASPLPGSQPGFIISASNNAGRGSSFPNNPGRMPITILDEGWFTFEHRFRDNGFGVLAVDMTIRDSLGVVRGMWTLSDPSDVISVTVGGNQYGWFAQNEFPSGLAFDTAGLIGFQDYCAPPASTPGAKVTGGGWIPWAGDKGTFGLTAKANNAGSPSGNLTYHDHAIDKLVKSTAITYVIVSGNCADIGGTAKVNNSGSFGFQVRVCDNDEPGQDNDTFTIIVSDGYTASGTLGGGNIQIH